ncbi:MAG: HEAT repeat domain-containing protein [Byssovorax sp.]
MGAADAESIRLSLSSTNAEERRLATSRLAELEPDQAIPLLVSALGDEDWRVRKEATVAARGIAPDAGLVDAMIDVLRAGDNVGLRNAAVEVLAATGSAATAGVRQALGELDADGRKLAVEALGGAGDPAALGPLEALLARDADDNVREAAALAIAQLGAIAPARVQEILLRSLDDRDHLVRLTALEGLSALRAQTPWERLAPLFDEPMLRGAAITAAALSDRPEAAQAVARELGRARSGAFTHALGALAQLAEGPLAARVEAALRAEGPALGERLEQLAADVAQPIELRAMALRLAASARTEAAAGAAFAALSEEMLADAARDALRVLGAPALPSMLAHLDDLAAPVDARAQLVDVLAEIASNHRGAVAMGVLAALRRAARDDAHEVGSGALNALARLGDESDLALAAAGTLSTQRAIVASAEAALSTLAGRFPEAARAHVARLVESEPHHLAAALIMGALAALGADELDDATFLAHVAATGNTHARRAAVLAVAEIGGAAAMEVLSFALADEEREVRFAAARALGRRCVALASPSPSEILDLVERTGAPELVATTVRAVGEGMSLGYSERRSAPPAPPPPELISVLALFARGAPSAVALAAVDALGQTIAAGTLAACEAIAAALEHPDPSVAKAAAFKLAETALGREALGRCLDHPAPGVRLLAVEMLDEVDVAGARARLTRRALIETDREVRAAIERALSPGSRGFGSIGPQSAHDGTPPRGLPRLREGDR